MFDIENVRNALNVWDPIVKYISRLRDVDLEGNLVKEWPKGENTESRFMNCFSIPSGVKIMIFITLVGFTYAVFNIYRASQYLDQSLTAFLIIVISQAISIIDDIFFLCIAVAFLNIAGKHTDDDRYCLVKAMNWLFAQVFFMHVGNGLGYLYLGVNVMTGETNRVWGVNNMIWNCSGFFGSLGPLFWFRESFV